MTEPLPQVDFWEITNSRRIELGKRWKDVLAETGLSHETLNRWRKGYNVDPLTDRALEKALLWSPGAREGATAGTAPVNSQDAAPSPEVPSERSPSLGDDSVEDVRDEATAEAIRSILAGLKPGPRERVWLRLLAELPETSRARLLHLFDRAPAQTTEEPNRSRPEHHAG